MRQLGGILIINHSIIGRECFGCWSRYLRPFSQDLVRPKMTVDTLVDSTYEIYKTGYEIDTQDYIQKADKFEETTKKDFSKRIRNEIKQIKYRTLKDVDKFFESCSDDMQKQLEKLKSRSRLAYYEVLSRKELDMAEFADKIREDREKCIQKLAKPVVQSEIVLDLLFLEAEYLKWIEKLSLVLVKKIRQEKIARSPPLSRISHRGVGEILRGLNIIGLGFLRMIELHEKMEILKEDDKKVLRRLAYWDLDTLVQWTQTLSQEEIDSEEINSDKELLRAIWG